MTDHGTLEIRSVGKRFDVAGQTVEALSGINLSVAAGEFVSIVGASGCGKSTLLRLIVGLERHYDGEILLKGKRLAGPTLDRAIVFQEHRLFPWLRVEDNVALGLLRSSWPAAEASIWIWSVSVRSPAPTRPSFPAACHSASPSPGPWSTGPTSCCLTNRSGRSTP